ncbi:DNA topoisomerase I [Candidatus Woesearchaeota archaeon]|nr:DNA topoisomerase I [Candidatus Woesearchaeota archaeon]
MSYELIITEKPSSAKKIADALASGKPIKESFKGVPYYKITHGKKDIVVCAAVGHLFGVAERNKGKWTYPVFDVAWKPTSEISKSSAFTKKYLNTIKKLSKDADTFVIATDFDIEGEVIGHNILKFICNKDDAKRMKFSTLTKPDLIRSYEEIRPTLEWGQANAGETRHVLDFFYGINLSRALSLAVKHSTGMFKILSSGRVQGPALKIIVDRELEINAFRPEPYWQIELRGYTPKEKEKLIIALHEKDKFWNKDEADRVMQNVKGRKALVSETKTSTFNQAPPTPFDLTTLQTEAYRTLNISPKHTLEIAQELYSSGYISYPRTSSQVLPKEIGYAGILTNLARQSKYKELCSELLRRKSLVPNNGKKTDPAHPAIYPTGIAPKVGGREEKVYDLIARRFMATFADPAVRETINIKIDVNKEIFIAKGTRTIEKGWHVYYGPFATFKEEEMPKVAQGDEIIVNSIDELAKETQPPKRYTQASIIKELEKRGLGTKATRAGIVDSLYDRGYVVEKSIKATQLGIRTVETLQKYSPEILDEALTRKFEDEMESIREKQKKGQEVLDDARNVLTKVLADFKKKEKEIGTELADAYKETRNKEAFIGSCPVCKEGTLQQRTGKFGRFIACDRYPDCKTTFSLPKFGKVKSAKKECEHCHYPMIIIGSGKKTQELCLNDKCPSKQLSQQAKQEIKDMESGKIEKKCPKCGSDMILRKSVYGSFLGCSKYPGCRHTERLENGNNNGNNNSDGKNNNAGNGR